MYAPKYNTAYGRATAVSASSAGAKLTALWLALAPLLAGTYAGSNPARAEDNPALVVCPAIVSLDQRLLMEQWAAADNCEQPVRTRVTDRFLGYTCTEQSSELAKCRSYLPAAGSRAFDTSGHFRCIDVAATASDDGITINRMREWVPPQPRRCDWNPYLNILATEIDFDNGQVCIAALCMLVDRLSSVGKLRLRQLIERAFRQMDIVAQATGPQLVGPVRHSGGR